MSEITYEELHRLFHYDPDTGLLVRKVRLNNSKAGTVVGSMDGHGYLCTQINGKHHKIHRIVYCMHHGYFPENEIDHINRIRHDNRIENLREVSRSCNLRNSKLASDNKSGIKGINWNKRDKRWKAEISVNKKKIYLGYFKNFDSAVVARYIAELKYSWNHCEQDSPAYQYLVEHGYLNTEKDNEE